MTERLFSDRLTLEEQRIIETPRSATLWFAFLACAERAAELDIYAQRTEPNPEVTTGLSHAAWQYAVLGPCHVDEANDSELLHLSRGLGGKAEYEQAKQALIDSGATPTPPRGSFAKY